MPIYIRTAPVPYKKPEGEVPDPEIPEVPPVALLQHDIDIPEEPENVDVVVHSWNAATRAWEEKSLGRMLLVPTGCDNPEYVSPYQNEVSFRSALPRDKAADANIYAQYQTNTWVSRDWVREQLDEDIDSAREDKKIADDIPFLLAAKGLPSAGVAQTPGVQPGVGAPGDNNGAPLPATPGPGRPRNDGTTNAGGYTPPGGGPANSQPGTGV